MMRESSQHGTDDCDFKAHGTAQSLRRRTRDLDEGIFMTQ